MAKPRARLALCACAFILLTFQSTCLGGGGEDVPGRTGGASTAAPQVHEAPPSGHVCDGGAVSVPMEFVNDDYCDCKDGSDEIKTSACAHTPAVFVCVNRGFVTRDIPTALVGDGICDCCDGSDEAGAQVESKCADTCMEQGQSLREESLQKLREVRKGIESLRQHTRDANSTIAEWRAKAAQKLSEYDEVLTIRDEVKDRLYYEEQLENDERVWRAREGLSGPNPLIPDEDATIEQMDLPDDTPVAARLLATRMPALPTFPSLAVLLSSNIGVESPGTFEATDADGGSDADEEEPAERKEGVSAFMEAVEAAERESVARARGDDVDDPRKLGDSRKLRKQGFLGPYINGGKQGAILGLKRVLQGAGLLLSPIRGAWELLYFIGSRLWRITTWLADRTLIPVLRLALNTLPNGEDPDVPETVAVGLATTQRVSQRAVLFSGLAYNNTARAAKRVFHRSGAEWCWRNFWDAVPTLWKWTFPEVDESWLRPHAVALRAVLKDVERELKIVKTQKEQAAEKLTKLDNIDGNARLFMLLDACAEKQTHEYKYSLCYMSEAKQNHVKLGSFAGWVDGGPPSEASRGPFYINMTEGQACHGGIKRSVKVELGCGSANALLDVREPNTCQYEMQATSPVACTSVVEQGLLEQLMGLGLSREEIEGHISAWETEEVGNSDQAAEGADSSS